MDFRLSEEQRTAKAAYFEVCEELAKKRPPGFFGFHNTLTSDEGWKYHRYCAKEFAKRGWLTLAWPAEYGGHGTIMDRVFLAEARGYHDVHGIDHFGVSMLAPTLLATASEEIKREFLPGIASGGVMWCEAWSEPNAGSDLAAATCNAVRKGDEYVINGQKIWTTGAHRADWGFGVFRTDPDARKHHNLSFLLFDMKTPGITVRPLLYMNMEHIYNETFFDDVHVPVKNLVGKEHEGWLVVNTLAAFERSNIELIMATQRMLEELVKYCNETKRNGKLLARDPVIRNRLAEVASAIEAARTLAYRVADLQSRHEMALIDAAAVKLASSELVATLASLGTDILGPYGQVKLSKWAPTSGLWEKEYQECFAPIISMGTNEIQKNIIAWYGLGLPRMK